VDLKRIKERIRDEEGLRLKPYKDSLGISTIGYGFRLDKLRLSIVSAEIILNDYVKWLQEDLEALEWYRGLSESVKEIIYEMSYQIGISGMLKFKKMIDLINLKDYEGASKEMRNSEWYKQTPNRVKRLVERMKNVKS